MPLRYDPLLVRALAREIRARWPGARARRLVWDRERRAGELRFREGPSLFFLLHPEDGPILPADGRLRGARHDLGGRRLTDVTAPPDERLLRLRLDGAGAGRPPLELAAELHTNQWNLLLLRASGGEAGDDEEPDPPESRRIQAVLWPREPGSRVLRPGRRYVPPRGERRWRSGPPGLDAWLELLEPVEPERRRGEALREVAYLSSVNVDHVLGEASAAPGREALAAAYGRYVELREADGGAWLLERTWGPQPYVVPLGEAARPADSLLDAMRTCARAGGRWPRLTGDAEDATEAATEAPPSPEVEELEAALRDRRAYLERRLASLRRELEEGPEPDELREKGNLLLARLDAVEKGQSSVRLEGFEDDAVEIDLDPALSAAENAERYYEEASRRERAARRIPREQARAREELEAVERALEELPESGVTDELWELAGGRPGGEEEPGEEGSRLPYRRLESSGGLEIRVGKGARDNEDLTFHHSHTEDVWLHARQVPGAHVILRWGRKEENPPRRDLIEAAVVAAVNSDARHSGTVAVDWTRRKYVRSPRKSPPGAVVPRNVQTLFVRPDPDLVKRLEPGRR